MSSYATLARARELATGSRLDALPPNVAPKCATEGDLDRLISDYHTFLGENIASDLTFLSQLDPSGKVEDFRRLIYNLRTASQHTDNPRAERTAKLWRAKYGPSQSAADALASSMETCLLRLAEIAVAVTRSVPDTNSWRELVAVDVGAIFTAVESDLGLRFSFGQRTRRIRQVEGRLKVTPIRGDRRTTVAEYCVQEVLSEHSALPVPYSEVLDSLGILGEPRAGDAILLAYAIAAAAPHLSGILFVSRVEEMWKTLLTDART